MHKMASGCESFQEKGYRQAASLFNVSLKIGHLKMPGKKAFVFLFFFSFHVYKVVFLNTAPKNTRHQYNYTHIIMWCTHPDMLVGLNRVTKNVWLKFHIHNQSNLIFLKPVRASPGLSVPTEGERNVTHNYWWMS